MITLSVNDCNPVSQDFYDNTISNLQFHQLSCSCGRSACLTIHGYYYRGVKSEDTIVRLRICRVICCHCGKTHALLLSAIVPYSQILLSDQIRILSAFEGGHLATDIMDQTPSIDENNLYSIIRQYLKHWRQRLLSIRTSLSSPSMPFQCFTCFRRQFMQNKHTSNLLFLTPT